MSIAGDNCWALDALESRMMLSAVGQTVDAPVRTGHAPAIAASVRPANVSAIVVGARETAAVGSIPQTTMDAIAAQLNFFFSHASVGGNILGGLDALHSANARRYRLNILSASDYPFRRMGKGYVYEFDRGNPGWQAKVDQFTQDMKNGWGNQVSVAINKFCFIDPDASLRYYTAAMSRLEALYPHTRFVYVTIPLTTAADGDNVLRNAFNTGLRNYVASTGKILYDLADIESHGPRGQLATFTARHTTYQRLYAGYAADEGHLNDLGSQQAALGWYALAARLVS